MLHITLIFALSFFGLGNAVWLKPKLIDNRIVGGVQVEIDEHPYQLSLQQYGQHICGASIIGRKWAVTAGHCVGSLPIYYQLNAGSTDKYRGTLYRIQNIIRHPRYDSRTIDYDIALIEITNEFEFCDTVQPVGLPDAELDSGSMVNITGWGALRQGGSGSILLQNVAVPIVGRDVCDAAYNFLNEITERMICAGNLIEGGQDACQGDSGGPLVAHNVLYGIVSWGYGCAQPSYPGVYTNVANLRDWIKEQSQV